MEELFAVGPKSAFMRIAHLRWRQEKIFNNAKGRCLNDEKSRSWAGTVIAE